MSDNPEGEETVEEVQKDGPLVEYEFADFDLNDDLLDSIEAAGYEHPTSVQVASIPPILEGREVVVQAKTGTGKTAAFGLPLLELLDQAERRVKALVLSPTRELAQQVAKEIKTLGARTDVKAVALYGGDPMPRQIKLLDDGAQIVVGTPGRVLDHLRRRTLDPRGVEYLVLDEADEMLSMGFARELAAILRFLPKERSTMLFSATFPPEIERLITKHVRDPLRLSLSTDRVVANAVEHHYYIAGLAEKNDYLVAVLDDERVTNGIVFCNRKDETRMVAKILQRSGYHAMPINSDLTQGERNEVMAAIKDKSLRILVATDIAARGIDISELSHVVNYSVPASPDVYVHRTGRTGRVGRKGTAVTLVSGVELSALKQAENIKGIKIHERRLPPEEQIMARRVERIIEDLQEIAKLRTPEEKVKGDREDFEKVVAELQKDPENQQVLYLLLQSFFEGIKRQTARAAEDTEAEDFATETSPNDRPSGRSREKRSGGRSDSPRRPRRR